MFTIKSFAENKECERHGICNLKNTEYDVGGLCKNDMITLIS